MAKKKQPVDKNRINETIKKRNTIKTLVRLALVVLAVLLAAVISNMWFGGGSSSLMICLIIILIVECPLENVIDKRIDEHYAL